MKPKRKRRKILLIAAIIAFLILAVPVALYFASGEKFACDEALFSAVRKKGVTKFYYDSSDNSGESISSYQPVKFAELGAVEKRDWISYNEVSNFVKNGFIAVEDRTFFEHNGVNLKRTLGAVANFIFNRDSSFGGSTITQQVIKNISGDNEKSVKRKVSEIFRAIHLENNHSKEEIFEVYLNIAPMGEGIVGVGLAAEKYFGKKTGDLSLAEAATLVGITNAPERYSPIRHPERCVNKRNTVLLAMFEMNFISREEYEDAIKEELFLAEQGVMDSEQSSWFVESVYDEVCSDLMKKYGYSKNAASLFLSNGGLSVYTTIDIKVQNKLEEYFENEDNFSDEIRSGLQYSMVIVDSETASLKGIVGAVGKKSAGRILNYATVARTPGSLLKPLALYAPLIDAKKINWSTVLDDSPVTYSENDNGETVGYPRNSPAVYEGEITVAEALAKSKNTVAVRLYDMLGAKAIYNNLKNNYGFNTLVEKETTADGRILTDLASSPLALGQLTHGVALRSLVEAYTVFPGEGALSSPKSYVAVFDSEEKLILEKTQETSRIMSIECAKIMNQLLCGVVEHGTASSIRLGELVDVAGKTGTSGGGKDKLFVGYTPYYTAGIWCGYADSSKAVSASPKNHLLVWDEVMRSIHGEMYEGNAKSFSVSGLEKRAYCEKSGNLYSFGCGENILYGYYINGTEPIALCEDNHGGADEEYY